MLAVIAKSLAILDSIFEVHRTQDHFLVAFSECSIICIIITVDVNIFVQIWLTLRATEQRNITALRYNHSFVVWGGKGTFERLLFRDAYLWRSDIGEFHLENLLVSDLAADWPIVSQISALISLNSVELVDVAGLGKVLSWMSRGGDSAMYVDRLFVQFLGIKGFLGLNTSHKRFHGLSITLNDLVC